jgi:hypothetical protein
LTAHILRKFVNPLINISVSEFKKGLAEGGNSSNAGLATAIGVDKLIQAISQIDCVVWLNPGQIVICTMYWLFRLRQPIFL